MDQLVDEKSLLRKRLANKTVQDEDCRKTIATHQLQAAKCKLDEAAHKKEVTDAANKRI